MKTIKYISLIIILINLSCCVNQKQKDDEQIIDTVKRFWEKTKNNDFEGYKNLVEDNENFLGGMQAEFSFIHKNYEKLNPDNILQKNIIIKDTSIAGPNTRQKYVQYIIKNKNDSNYLKKPLIITLLFYKPIGYNKIFNRKILQNYIGWDKQLNQASE